MLCGTSSEQSNSDLLRSYEQNLDMNPLKLEFGLPSYKESFLYAAIRERNNTNLLYDDKCFKIQNYNLGCRIKINCNLNM